MNDLRQYTDKMLLDLFRSEKKLKGRIMDILWNKYSKKLYQFCKFKSAGVFEAEEIHQKAWIRFYNYIDSGKTVGSIEPFLYKTAYYLSLEKYRKNKNERFIRFDSDTIDIFEYPDNLMQNIENDELINKINIAVNMLDESYRDVFLLRWFAQLPFEEIAQIVGETVDCVKKRSYRSMEKVIKILKPIIKELAKG